MTIEKLRPTYTFTQERLAALQAVVPEAFADGRINWERLREALGDYLEAEEADAEHFGLTWPGKRAARRLAATPSPGTLRPAPGEGIDEATTRNLFIEGDNLEVLKLLQKSYAGRVKLIYIDPPYNTGNDFIYKDNFSEPLESYLRRTGQTGEEGELLTTNPKAGGRFHSNWLNMMYPRLLLAKNLLQEEGLIFVSIDDNEIHNLRAILNEIFGEENFMACIIWQKMDSPSRNDPNRVISNYHDYVLAYTKAQDVSKLQKMYKPDIIEGYTIQLPDGTLGRRRQLRKNGKGAKRADRPSLWYPLTAPDGTIVYPIAPEGWEGRWVLSKETWEEREQAKLTEWIKRDYGWVPYYIETAPSVPSVPWSTLWTDTDQNRQSMTKFTELMGANVQFDNPKPVDLISRMLQIALSDECICMDFFSGSATTAHSVLQLNREDGGNRRFILVQLPEPTNNPQFPTIAEIGKERIRRVSQRMKAEDASKLLTERETPEDLGFKVFKLGRSHFKTWSADAAQTQGEDPGALPTLFDAAESPLVDGWQPDDLLVEILLQEGFPLDSRITVLEFYQQNWVWQVESEACAHHLFVCLDDRLHAATIAGAERIANGLFICLDTALSDEEKLRLADHCRLKVI